MKCKRLITLLMAALLALCPVCGAWAEQVDVEVVDMGATTPPQEDAPTPNPDGTPAPDDGDHVVRTMYAKKEIKLFKARSTSSKVLARIKKGEEVTILSYAKSWSEAEYGGEEGYVRSSYITDKAPTPTPDPGPDPGPTPDTGDRRPSVPDSRAYTYYTKGEATVSVLAAEVITAFVVDYQGLGEGYFNRIFNLVSSNIDGLLQPVPDIPPGLADYEKPLKAVCEDLVSGLTFELLGKQLNSKKSGSASILSQSGSVIGVTGMTMNESGQHVVDFGAYPVKSVDKGTYYLQMQVKLSTAPALKALYGTANTITLLYPVKIAKMSSGGGGGGGGGGSSKQQPVARLIVAGVRTEPAQPKAGEVFDIIISLRNTSDTQYLRNMQITYTSEEDALVPTKGTNTEYISRIDAGADYPLKLTVRAKPDLEVSSVKLDLAAEFEDKQLSALTASQSLIIPVQQVQRIQLDEPKLPTTTTVAGDSYEIEMGVFNLGKTMLYNVTVKAIPEDEEKVAAGASYYIGNMDPGSSKKAELELIPLEGGSFNASLEVTYETVEGESKKESKPITFTAEAEEQYDDTPNEYENGYNEPEIPQPPTVTEVLAVLPWQIYALVGGLVLVLVVWVGVALHRRRLRAMEDDEMD